MKKKQKRRQPSKQHGSTAIVKRNGELDVPKIPDKVEQALIGGNLINLSSEERVSLVMATCKSLRLNPLTNPFIFILVQDWENDSERLILYASRNCTDQLRMIHGVTEVQPLEQWDEDEMLMARAYLRDRSGRCASDIGAIPRKRYSKKKGTFYELSGSMLANAKMHVGTKATRRATLKLVGLGGAVIDESELDTMNVIGGVTREGRIYRHEGSDEVVTPRDAAHQIADAKTSGTWCEKHRCDFSKCPSDDHTPKENEEMDKAAQNAKPKPAKKPDPKQGDSAKDVPKAATAPAASQPAHKYELTIDWSMDRNAPVLTGYVKELVVALGDIKLEWKNEFWHAAAKDIPAIMQIAGQKGFLVKEIQPGSSATQRTAPVAQGKTGGSSGLPPATPSVVSGVVERVTSPTTSKGQPMRQVTILMPDKKKPTYGCFQAKLFVYLDAAKGAIEALVTTNGKYLNLVGLKRIVTTKGVVDFDDDGVTPAIQRNREAGTPPSLFNE